MNSQPRLWQRECYSKPDAESNQVIRIRLLTRASEANHRFAFSRAQFSEPEALAPRLKR
jgi:hypothetical protein